MNHRYRHTIFYRVAKFILGIVGVTDYPLPFARTQSAEPLLDRAIAAIGKDPDPNRCDEQFYTYYSEMFGHHEILQQQYLAYLPFIHVHPQSFLDIGCGAGEFLEFLGHHGITDQGIDANRSEVARAREKGLNVECADAVTFLAGFDGSFSGISMLEVIEHVPPKSMSVLMTSLYRALIPGGIIIIETINIKHPWAFHVFYTDPTHLRPIPSDFLVFLLQWVGFVHVKLVYTLPYGASYLQSRDPSRAYFDYAVIASKPENLTDSLKKTRGKISSTNF